MFINLSCTMIMYIIHLTSELQKLQKENDRLRDELRSFQARFSVDDSVCSNITFIMLADFLFQNSNFTSIYTICFK
jgi:hypothetical protein